MKNKLKIIAMSVFMLATTFIATNASAQDCTSICRNAGYNSSSCDSCLKSKSNSSSQQGQTGQKKADTSKTYDSDRNSGTGKKAVRY